MTFINAGAQGQCSNKRRGHLLEVLRYVLKIDLLGVATCYEATAGESRLTFSLRSTVHASETFIQSLQLLNLNHCEC